MKDSYWFSHDYEPMGDPKMQAMLNDYGGLGYGMFWRIAEMLHSDKTHRLPFKKYIFAAIAKQMSSNGRQMDDCFNTIVLSRDVEKFIGDCVNEYELFRSDNSMFWSDRVIRNIEKKQAVSEVRSIAGKLGANAKQNLANADQNLAIKGKEIKGKEIKGKEIKGRVNCRYDSILKLKNAAAAVIKDYVSETSELRGIPENLIKDQSMEFAKKYFPKQPINSLQALVTSWMKKYFKEAKEKYGMNGVGIKWSDDHGNDERF